MPNILAVQAASRPGHRGFSTTQRLATREVTLRASSPRSPRVDAFDDEVVARAAAGGSVPGGRVRAASSAPWRGSVRLRAAPWGRCSERDLSPCACADAGLPGEACCQKGTGGRNPTWGGSPLCGPPAAWPYVADNVDPHRQPLPGQDTVQVIVQMEPLSSAARANCGPISVRGPNPPFVFDQLVYIRRDDGASSKAHPARLHRTARARAGRLRGSRRPGHGRSYLRPEARKGGHPPRRSRPARMSSPRARTVAVASVAAMSRRRRIRLQAAPSTSCPSPRCLRRLRHRHRPRRRAARSRN
jgi:hypothetical protein